MFDLVGFTNEVVLVAHAARATGEDVESCS
jgi:hypothetical protein